MTLSKVKTFLSVALIMVFTVACSQATDTVETSSPTVKTEGEYKKVDRTYFKLDLYDGGKADLADWNKKPVVICFITSVCPFCKKIAPDLNKIYSEYKDKGIGVLMISLDDDIDGLADFIKENKIEFPVAINGVEAAVKYKARGVPYTFVLNKKHKIEDYWIGFAPNMYNELDKTLKEVLAEED